MEISTVEARNGNKHSRRRGMEISAVEGTGMKITHSPEEPNELNPGLRRLITGHMKKNS
jgi:hypothetical protein